MQVPFEVVACRLGQSSLGNFESCCFSTVEVLRNGNIVAKVIIITVYYLVNSSFCKDDEA